MEGLEVSVLKLSTVLYDDENLRIESEFFKKEYLLLNRNLSFIKTNILDVLSHKITDGTHYTPNYQEQGIPFLSALNIKENFLDLQSNYNFISDREHKFLYNRCNPQKGDILLRKVGVGARWACVVPENIFEFSLFVSVALIKLKSGVNPYYISTFINSSLGQKQLLRFNKGISQPDLHLEEIKKLKIPILSQSFQDQIETLIRFAHVKSEESRTAYTQSEKILLETLGLDDLKFENTSVLNINIKKFSTSWGSSGRLDAEYYQTKHDRIYEVIQKTKPIKIVTLKELREVLTNGHTPLRHDLSTGEVVFLTAEHIFDFKINYDSNKRINITHHLSALRKTSLRKNDVLITIKGKVGNAAVVDRDNIGNVNINQDVALLRLKKGIDPYYICSYINSVIGKSLVERMSTGQINPFLALGNLENIMIPIYKNSDEIGNNIRNTLIDGERAARLSKFFLSLAKHAVEIAIKEGEAAAENLIHTEYKHIEAND